MQRVQNNPQMFAEEEGDGVRLCRIRRFPFAVVYLNEEDRISIVAVADQRRRPRYWIRRLQG